MFFFSKNLQNICCFNNCFLKNFCRHYEKKDTSIDTSSNFLILKEKKSSTSSSFNFLNPRENNGLTPNLEMKDVSKLNTAFSVSDIPSQAPQDESLYYEKQSLPHLEKDDFHMSMGCIVHPTLFFPNLDGSSDLLASSESSSKDDNITDPPLAFPNVSGSEGFSTSRNDSFSVWAADQLNLMEQHYHEVKRLLSTEYLLEAHVEYLHLMEKLDRFLKMGDIHILCVLRPKGYLQQWKASLTNCRESEISVEPLSGDEGKSTVHEGGMPCKSTGTITIFGRSMSLFKSPFSTLCRPISKHMEGGHHQHYSSEDDVNADRVDFHVKVNEYCIGCSLMNALSHENTFLFRLGLLAEPITLCPLNSLSPLKRSHEGVSDFLNKPKMLRDSKTRFGLNVDLDSQLANGRFLIKRPVFSLGELPAMVYSIRSPSNSKDTGFKIDSSKLTVSKAEESSISSKREISDSEQTDLALSIDIQIVLVHNASHGSSNSCIQCNNHLESSSVSSKSNNKTTSFSQEQSMNLCYHPVSLSPALHSIQSYQSNSLQDIKHNGCVSRVYSFLEKLVNNGSIHRLRMQYYQSERAITILNSIESGVQKKTWNHIVSSDYKAAWNLTADGKAVCMIEGTMKTPLFRCLSIINESDLHKDWLPFVSESKKLYQLSLFTQVLRQRTKFPWPLQDRESVLLGCAIDGLRLSTPCILMNGESVPEDVASVFGRPLSAPKEDLIRMNVSLFTFQLTPNSSDPQLTTAKLLVLLDPKISFVPKSVQTFIARQSAARLFMNMQRLCAEFDQSIYALRVAENPKIYDVVKQRLSDYYSNNESIQYNDNLTVCQ